MNREVAPLIARLRSELQRYYPAWKVQNLTIAGQGLESLVCMADSEEHGRVAIRVPWSRRDSNENDNAVDNRQLLRQEAVMARHLKQQGVPVPEVYLVHTEGDLDFLISSYVVHDGTPVPSHALGQLAAAIHRSPLPSVRPYGQGATPLPNILANRMERRMHGGTIVSSLFSRLISSSPCCNWAFSAAISPSVTGSVRCRARRSGRPGGCKID